MRLVREENTDLLFCIIFCKVKRLNAFVVFLNACIHREKESKANADDYVIHRRVAAGATHFQYDSVKHYYGTILTLPSFGSKWPPRSAPHEKAPVPEVESFLYFAHTH